MFTIVKALVGPIIHSLRRFVCSSSKYTAPHLQPPGHSNNGGFFVGSNFCNLMPHARVWSIVRNKAKQIRVKSFHKLCKVFSWRYKVVTFNSLSFIQMIWFMIHTYASLIRKQTKIVLGEQSARIVINNTYFIYLSNLF